MYSSSLGIIYILVLKPQLLRLFYTKLELGLSLELRLGLR